MISIIRKISILLFIFLVYFFIQKDNGNDGWSLYTSSKYQFQINYPTKWKIYENNDDIDPVIMFYPPESTGIPESFMVNSTGIFVYPHGYKSESLGTESKLNSEKSNDTLKYTEYALDATNEIFASMIKFEGKYPSSWSQDGFIIGRQFVSDFKIECVNKMDKNKCDAFAEDTFVVKGVIMDYTFASRITSILSSFSFTN